MPGIFDPLDSIKMALMADASNSLSEADAYEQAFAHQIAQRRRMERLAPPVPDAAHQSSPDFKPEAATRQVDVSELSGDLGRGRAVSPAAYAGLHPHEIAGAVASGQSMAQRRQAALDNIDQRQWIDDTLVRALAKDAAAAGMPNATFLDADLIRQPGAMHGESLAPPSNFENEEMPIPNVVPPRPPMFGPAEQKFGRFENARTQMQAEGLDPNRIYQLMAAEGDDPYAFARNLAGQLSVQRQRQMGPDPELDQLMYSDMPVY